MFLYGHIKGDFQTCISVLLMDLSNVFDTINHELTVAKLYVYGFSIEALQSRPQRVKINATFISWDSVIPECHNVDDCHSLIST